jgi:hypothetical protein
MQQDEMLRHLKDIRDGINRMAGGNVSMNDNSTTVTNNSGIVMPRGATVDLLDGGLALGVSGPR